jgi:hypothetical protein
VFATVTHFYPSLIFTGKARCLTLELCPVRGFTLVGLRTNIGLVWKRVAVANTLAYFDTATIKVVKSFIVQTPGLSFFARIALC